MHSRQTFLHPPRGAISDGVTERGGSTGFWTSPRSRVARGAVKRAPRQGVRRPTKRLSEASEPVLPRKTSSEPLGARTANRHRWVGRIYQGDRENHGQGTRQNGPVTSGEGALPQVMDLASGARGSRSGEAQTTVYQKHRTLLKS